MKASNGNVISMDAYLAVRVAKALLQVAEKEVRQLADEMADCERLLHNARMMRRPKREIAEIEHMILSYRSWIANLQAAGNG